MMGRVVRLGGFMAVAIGAVAACSTSSSSGQGYGPVAQSEFPGAFARAVCSGFGSCCSPAGLPFDLNVCEQRMAAGYVHDSQNRGVDPAAYDEAASASCLAAVAVAARQCNLDVVIGSRGPCGPFFYPVDVHGKAGDPCNGNCRFDGTGATCTSIGYAPDGGELSPVRCFANDGLVCGASGLCEQLPSAGQPCLVSWPMNGGPGDCDINSLCDANNICQPLQPEGGACTQGNQCAQGLYCPAAYGTSVCPPAGGQCTVTTGPPYCAKQKPNGAACDDYTQCLSGTCESGTCGGPSQKLVSFLCSN